ncbi:hypothetical protein THRCLA_02747 [Thraustotheca clavata]|uniref:Uncharacterized protein n=1 Tax=Thraustotheca clavata TaxID=74557 RepID=A0A1W0A4W9_9STRA|nr:hypothetical protein THRCLA_02747 [Thraustotheca clavata]
MASTPITTPGPYATVFSPQAEQTTPKPRRRMKIVIVVVALCGAILISIGAVVYTFQTKVNNHSNEILSNIQHTPGLRFTVTAKRQGLTFNGKSSAQIYVIPKTQDQFEFDAFLAQEGPEVTEQYLIKDGRAYWSVWKEDNFVQGGCLSEEQIPPFELMESSLTSANVVDYVNGTSITASDCPNGKLLYLKFAGESYVFCNSNQNKLTHASSSDLDITVEYLTEPSFLPAMDIPGNLTCDVVVPASIPSPKATLMQTSNEIYSAWTTSRTATLRKSSCACKSTPKPCLFVHGVGQATNGPLLNTFKDSWGEIHDHAPCCSSIKFAQFETTKRGWANDELQQQFCSAALQVSGSNSKEFSNMILVTYSMGNLIASAAAATNKCTFGNDVTWVSIAGPMQGSKTANLLQEKCIAGGWGAGLKSILSTVGFCPVTDAYLSLKHQTTVDGTMKAKFQAAQAIRSKYVSHLMCGTSSNGLVSFSAAGLVAVGKMSNHDDPMYDGVVDLSSCTVGVDRSRMGTDADSSYHYEASINHLDASFRHGDGWWGSNRKPIKWFECAL